MLRLAYRRSGKPFLITLEPRPNRIRFLEIGVVFLLLAAVGIYALAGGR